jgi:hypothetical protein
MIMTLNHAALAETFTIMSVVQIGYSTVFFFEYLGPMLIYPLFFLFPSVFYGKYVLAAGQSVHSSAAVALRCSARVHCSAAAVAQHVLRAQCEQHSPACSCQ